MNEISKDLIEAYNAAKFRVFDGDKEIILEPNMKSDKLVELHVKYCVIESAIITAYNPYSEGTEKAINEAAQSILIDTVSNQWAYLRAEGFEPSGHWLPESSILILGIELQDALSLGNQFKQNAIIFISDGGNVNLYDCASGEGINYH